VITLRSALGIDATLATSNFVLVRSPAAGELAPGA
jgi:hypothetical protein